MIIIKKFTFNVFQENTYVLHDETNEAIIIDPGCMTVDERKELLDYINNKKLTVKHLINTHCHIDHILGNDFVMSSFQVPLTLHKDEVFTYKDTKRWTVMFNLPDFEIPENLVFIDENSIIEFGNTKLTCILTPGHSIASLSFYCFEQNFIIIGDVIFNMGIGRTDLPGGNFSVLINTIQNKIFTLPNETVIYSGHGTETTVLFEKMNNPYIPKT